MDSLVQIYNDDRRPKNVPNAVGVSAMIELSEDQVLVLKKEGQHPPKVVNPQTHEEFFLIRCDVYNRLRTLLDAECSAEDAFRAQIESAATAGWDDPALDIYNDPEPAKS